jgi:hypothetical protein
MSQAISNTAVEDAAIKAVYDLQYNSSRAARFVMGEVPKTSYEMAINTINRVVRPTPKAKKK